MSLNLQALVETSNPKAVLWQHGGVGRCCGNTRKQGGAVETWGSRAVLWERVGAGGAALLPPLSANWPSLCSALWTTSTAAVPRRGQNILIRCDIRWVDAHFVDGVPAGSRRRVVFHGTFCKLKKKFFPFGPLKRKPLYVY